MRGCRVRAEVGVGAAFARAELGRRVDGVAVERGGVCVAKSCEFNGLSHSRLARAVAAIQREPAAHRPRQRADSLPQRLLEPASSFASSRSTCAAVSFFLGALANAARCSRARAGRSSPPARCTSAPRRSSTSLRALDTRPPPARRSRHVVPATDGARSAKPSQCAGDRRTGRPIVRPDLDPPGSKEATSAGTPVAPHPAPRSMGSLRCRSSCCARRAA